MVIDMPQWFWWAYDSVNTKAWHVANIRADTCQGGQITVRIGNTELVNSSRTWLCWPADFNKNYPPCRSCQCIQKYPIVWLYHWLFLSRVSTLTRDIDITILSVRPSVRNVPVSDENGLTYRHSFFHHTVARLFYQHQTSSRNSDGSPPAGALSTGGV